MNIKQIVKRIVKYILYGIPQVKTPIVVSVNFNDLLRGRVALVTGGTSGIGKAIAEAFLKCGATVVITGRTQSKIDIVLESLDKFTSQHNSVFGFELNNSKPSSFEAQIKMILDAISPLKIDILVNNAGVGGGDISNTTEDEFDNVLQTNLKGCFFLSKLIYKYMIDNKIMGNILNIASSSSLRPAASAYTLSKWGIRGFTLGLAKTLEPYGITVNGLAPGPTATPMLGRDASDISFPQNPAGRYAMPEEIANMAVVLVSGMGKMVVGDIVYMTGGAGVITYDDIKYSI